MSVRCSRSFWKADVGKPLNRTLGLLFAGILVGLCPINDAISADSGASPKNQATFCTDLARSLRGEPISSLTVRDGRTESGREVNYEVDLDHDGKVDHISISGGSQETLVTGRLANGQTFEHDAHTGVGLIRFRDEFYFVEGLTSETKGLADVVVYQYSSPDLNEVCSY